ncbi:hypothetical protein [Butyrivibrio sp. NC3005]|uniref:hypothetical protein n=1 Tax=Butyrivibrio sp. NC3005 TaxID=1280685 RepID=UPI000411D374|nr:hypothetical protein [Butyrivibrio sp. NC3005]
MRVSRHNGRSGAHGAYNPKHNDREFELEKAEELKKELTRNNLYWNCIDREIVRHEELKENANSFTDVEKAFYNLVYGGYVEGQNQRNTEARHPERNRTTDDLRMNPKTCPEETIYQIGNIDEHVSYEVLAEVAVEFLIKMQERYGEHFHILDWALHLDESTPHIHERHVFDVVNGYGERQPKQEQALKELGFELPDPDKKPGKYNNRKMSFDAECRKLFMETCKEHGLQIDEKPIYGGQKYKEKKEYVIDKLNADLEELTSKYEAALSENNILAISNEECRADNERLRGENEALTSQIEELLDRKENLELEIEDVEGLVDKVSDIAYEKACDKLVDEIANGVRIEGSREIGRLKTQIMETGGLVPKPIRKVVADQLTRFQDKLSEIKDRVVTAVKARLSAASVKKQYVREIAYEAKPSINELLEKARNKAERDNRQRELQRSSRSKKHDIGR